MEKTRVLWKLSNNWDCETFMCQACLNAYKAYINSVDVCDDNATWVPVERLEAGKDYGWGMEVPDVCPSCKGPGDVLEVEKDDFDMDIPEEDIPW